MLISTAGGQRTVLNGEPTHGTDEHASVRFDRQHSSVFGDSSVVGKAAVEPVAGTNLEVVPGIGSGVSLAVSTSRSDSGSPRRRTLSMDTYWCLPTP